jgi:S1-C subfamily serine protease
VAYLGSVSGELAKAEDLSVNEGAYVSGFGDMEDKSAAKEAGIQKGDVIVKLDQAIIKSSAALIEYIGRKRPGDKIAVVVNRKGTEKNLPGYPEEPRWQNWRHKTGGERSGFFPGNGVGRC